MATGKDSAAVNRIQRRIGAEAVAGLPEWQLVERFATTGDESAFEAIVARFGPMILGVCRRVLSDEADVDDAFQATFFVLVRKSRTLGRSVALGHWLYGVAYRVALRARADARRRHSRERFGAPVECRPQHYEDDPARFEIAGVLDAELSRLPAKYRAPVVLCYFEGLTHEEAALRLGWPVGSVKGRLARARDLLRHRLTRRGLTLATGAVATALSVQAVAVPIALGRRTCRAAVQLASGKVAGGAVAASVALLLRQELRSLFLASCKTVGAGVLLFVAGASLLIRTPIKDRPPNARPPMPRAGSARPAETDPATVGFALHVDPAGRSTTALKVAPPRHGVAADVVPAAADARPSSPVWAEYDAQRAKIGPGADAQVRLALWCEEHGLMAQRHQHLAKAVLIDSRNTVARGLMARLEYQGRWIAPEAAAAAVKGEGQKSAALAEYNARRDKLNEQAESVKARVAETEKRLRPAARAAYRARHSVHHDLAIDHLKLALWCERAGLEAEATVEFSMTIHLDPSIDEAWRHLGYVRHDGQWMLEAQATALTNEARSQSEANSHWVPALKKWQAWLGDPKLRLQAEEQLTKVTDPRAVVAVGRVFCDEKSIADQAWAVRILGPIDAPASTRLLAMLAVYSDFDEIRRAARALLPGRLPRDYLESLVEMIHTPAQFAIEPVQGPGSSGLLVVETPRFRLQRSYEAPPAVALNSSFCGYVGYDVNGLPIAINGGELGFTNWVASLPVGSGAAGALASGLRGAYVIAEAENRTAALIAAANLKADAAQEWLTADIRDLNQSNAQAVAVNARVGQILQDSFGAPDLKDDEVAWHRWYFDRIGYSYTPPPQVNVTEVVPNLPPPILYSCFAGGTLVRTLDGLRAIEQIRPGDRVLSQDTATGALAFESVLVAHHNPPARTVRLTLDNGEVLVPSIYHRFWICGQGWTMARDLKPGDAVRMLGGRVTVARAEPGDVVPVYNLDVAREHTYFVGNHDYLVHDNTRPDAETTPFDARTGPDTESVANPK